MSVSSSPYAIETKNLKKAFGDNVAVKALTLQVLQGEVFGFLGPNGAGKTTSIKMLLGLITPTSGEADILGVSIHNSSAAQAARARVGFLPEHFRFHEWLSADEFLTLHGQLYGMDWHPLQKRIASLLDLVGLTPFRKKYLRTFSKGMLQRIGLAQALLNSPALVILDEPTSGLDPVGRRLVRDIVNDLRQQGTCVFINSHLLSEIEIVCDRVAFIKHGEVIRITELNTLGRLQPTVKIHAKNIPESALAGLSNWGSVVENEDGERITMTITAEEFIPSIARHLVESGAEVYALTPQRVSLEELFIQTLGTDGGL